MSKFRRQIIFAILMSLCTSVLVSGAILAARGTIHGEFLTTWFKSIALAWPIVFVSILTIAPLINRLLDHLLTER